VILIDGDEGNGDHSDDISGFTEGDNFSIIHIATNCNSKTLCRDILRGRKIKKEIRKKERKK
jgi:hypothetical protein